MASFPLDPSLEAVLQNTFNSLEEIVNTIYRTCCGPHNWQLPPSPPPPSPPPPPPRRSYADVSMRNIGVAHSSSRTSPPKLLSSPKEQQKTDVKEEEHRLLLDDFDEKPPLQRIPSNNGMSYSWGSFECRRCHRECSHFVLPKSKQRCYMCNTPNAPKTVIAPRGH